jgi:hypothetical protein
MRPAHLIARVRPATNQTRSSRQSDVFDRPDADPLGLRRVLTQALHDLYGTKDVQDAITASYVWMADQVGHLALGFLPTLLLCWIWQGVWACLIAWTGWLDPGSGWAEALRILGLVAATAAIFAYWIYKERTDYHDTKQRAGDTFPFDSADILWNVKTALLYFAIGGLLALAAFIHWLALVIVLLLALWPAFRVALWWLRRKLAFQQAGLPFLYRLANFTGGINDPAKQAATEIANLLNREIVLSRVCFGRDVVPGNSPRLRHLLLTGPLGTGKTSLAVGIGTEFAFALGIGRYLSAAKLVQLAAGPAGDPAQMEYKDGRLLWPWKQCDLLVVDDVDAGVDNPVTGTATHLVDPANFAAALGSGPTNRPLAWLADRRSVWILGDAKSAPAWQAAIAGMMNIPPGEIMIVELQRPLAPPAARASA